MLVHLTVTSGWQPRLPQSNFCRHVLRELNVPADAEGQLYLQTYKNEDGYKGVPDRTLLHLIEGQTYKISFIAASEDGKGRIKIMLKDVKDMSSIYDSAEADGGWLNIGKEPRAYTKLYTHNSETIMDVRLEFDIGSKEQILYLDKVDLIRN